jgi:hypothetical protein
MPPRPGARRLKDRRTWIADDRIAGDDVEIGGDAALRECERLVRPFASTPGSSPPERSSLRWCADATLDWIEKTRSARVRADVPALEHAALRAGAYYKEWCFRRAYGEAAQYVRRVKAKNKKAGRRRGRDRRDAAQDLKVRIAHTALELRAKFPHLSIRGLARKIAPVLHTPDHPVTAEMVRRHLKRARKP